jgi:threonine dehydratase
MATVAALPDPARPAPAGPDLPMVTLLDIEAARRRIREHVFLTPCARSEYFSRALGCEAYFKLENLQMTGSFKERGALNKLLALTPEERARGIICASAGNHAQGVAYHAGRLNIPATIVMPDASPLIKVTSTRAYGAKVLLFGANFDESLAEARRLEQEGNLVFVHPFDDPAVIAGQGTIGLELMEQNPFLETVIVPIGGGGLIAGVACAMKEVNPRIRIVGVETDAVPKVTASLAAGMPVTVEAGRTIADGIAVRRPGELTFPMIQKYVDEVVTCDDEEISNAILLLLEREKTVAEGAGAITLAAALNRKTKVAGKRVLMLVGGGNIDVNLISRIIERGLVKDGRLVRLTVTVTDRPGALAKLTEIVARQRANVVEIHHNRAFIKTALGDTAVELVLETRGRDHIDDIVRELESKGYAVAQDR